VGCRRRETGAQEHGTPRQYALDVGLTHSGHTSIGVHCETCCPAMGKLIDRLTQIDSELPK